MSIGLLVLVLVFILIILVLILYFERNMGRLRVALEQEKTRSHEIAKSEANQLFNQWTETTLKEMTEKMDESIRRDYEAKLESWKIEYEEKIRKDAIQRSLRTLAGKVSEEFSPLILSAKLSADMRDFRHLGSPVDFIVFRGLSSGEDEVDVVFLEIKSGSASSIAERERRVKRAVDMKRVSYQVVNLSDILGLSSGTENASGHGM
ncbi:MAG: Holliday junction resolvase-like protein [Thermoplasmata archaeon]